MLHILPAPFRVSNTLCWLFTWSFSVPSIAQTVHPLMNYMTSLNELRQIPHTTKTFIGSNFSRFNRSWALTLYLKAECDPLHPLTGLSLYSSLSSWSRRHRLMDGERLKKNGLLEVSEEQRDWTIQWLEKTCRKLLKYLRV